MEIFKNFEPNGEFEKNQKLIADLKTKIVNNMVKMKFNKYEQAEVMTIIESAEAKISEIKESLVGTNIDTNPTKPTAEAMEAITKITSSLVKDIPKKVRSIIAFKEGLM